MSGLNTNLSPDGFDDDHNTSNIGPNTEEGIVPNKGMGGLGNLIREQEEKRLLNSNEKPTGLASVVQMLQEAQTENQPNLGNESHLITDSLPEHLNFSREDDFDNISEIISKVNNEGTEVDTRTFPALVLDAKKSNETSNTLVIDEDDDDELENLTSLASKVQESDNEEEDGEGFHDFENLLSPNYGKDPTTVPTYINVLSEEYLLETLQGEFRDLAEELISFTPIKVSDRLVEPLDVALEDFMSYNIDDSFLPKIRDYSIVEFVRMDTSDPFVKLVLGIQNLKENQIYLDSTHQKNINRIEESITYTIRDFSEKRISIINEFEESLQSKERESRDFMDAIQTNISLLNTRLDSSVDSIISELLNAKGSTYNKYFEEAMELKERIDSKKAELDRYKQSIDKNEVEDFSGYDFIRVKEDSLEDIKALMEQVRGHVVNFEFKDVPYFKKYVERFFNYFFLLTSKADGEVRSLMFLLNMAAFTLFLKYLSPAFIVFILTTISVDALQFFKLVDRSKSTAVIVQYSKDIEAKIQAIKNKALSEIKEECDGQVNLLHKLLRDKVQTLKTYKGRVEDYCSMVITSFISVEEIKDMTSKKMRFLERKIKKLGDKKIEEIKKAFLSVISDIPGEIERYADELKKAPNLDIIEKDFKNSHVWNNSYKVGRYGVRVDNLELGIDSTVTLDEGSYLIKVSSPEEKRKAFEFLSNILVQQYNNIIPESLKVNYVDVTNLGADLIPMTSIDPNVSNLIIEEEDYKKLIKSTREEIGNRYSNYLKGYDTITDFNEANKDDQSVKKVPYIVNVFYGLTPQLSGEAVIKSLAQSSKKAGIQTILFVEPSEMYRLNQDNVKEATKEQLDIFGHFDYEINFIRGEAYLKSVKGTNNVDGQIFKSRDGMEKFSMSFNEFQYMDKIKQVEGAIADTKLSTIYYEELKKHYADVLHQGDTLSGVELCLGYVDGDYSKPFTSVLGDNTIHALMGGSTGSGKSNTINVIIANLIAKYSPKWLELYMLDFKIVEFKFYTNLKKFNKFTKSVSRLPQASLIAGTKDPEYAESIFRKAVKEMLRRYKLMANGIVFEGRTHSFKKIEDWNRFIIDNNIPESEYQIIPRIVMIIDEFQAMFKMEDEEKKAFIKRSISDLGKEGRAAGIHMFFTSQSMENTVPDDVKDQFVLRYCLAASSTVSSSVIGNKAASTISGKGYIYMNDHSSRDEEYNVKLKVPFIPPNDLLNLMTEVEDNCLTLNKESNNIIPYYRKDYYDEEVKHKWDELEMYTTNPKVLSEPDNIILGQRTAYDDNPFPANFNLGVGDGEHILITANSNLSVANITNTILESIYKKNNGNNVMFYLNYDLTIEGMIKTDRFFSKGLLEFAEELKDSMEKVFDVMIEEIFEVKLEQYNDMDKLKPTIPLWKKGQKKKYLIINGLNKSPGFNGDAPDHNVLQKFMWLLKWGPMYGFHIITSWKEPFRSAKYMPYFSYRIAGKISGDYSREIFRHQRASTLNTGDNGYFGLMKNTITDVESKFKIFEWNYDPSLLADKQLNISMDFGEGVLV